MRDNDSLILESLYSSILLNENSDEEYMRLAKNPEENKEALQRMVDEAARRSGWNNVWHITTPENQSELLGSGVFRANEDQPTWVSVNKNISDQMLKSLSVMNTFKTTEEVDRWFGEQGFSVDQIAEALSWYDGDKSIENPPKRYIVLSDLFRDTPDRFGMVLWNDFARKFIGKKPVQIPLRFKGKLPLGYENVFSMETTSPEAGLAVTAPNFLKSSDPVTYDDEGNIIPLSQRFDSSNDDIRY